MIKNIKKNWKKYRIMKCIWFLYAILLISTIYYVKAEVGKDPTTPSTNSVPTTSFPTDPTLSYSLAAQNSTDSATPTASISLGSIEGQVFEDLNINGIRDLEQAGLAGDEVVLFGWQINLKGKDVTNKPVSLTTTTDINGIYIFSGLTAGNYVVSEVLQSSWATSVSEYKVTLVNDSDIYGQDFGNFHKGKIIGGMTSGRYQKIEKTFGIVAELPPGSCNPHCIAKGRVEYQDNSTNLKIESIQINTVATTLDKRRGVITGLAKVNGIGSYPFMIYVEDDSENDLFDISLPTYKYSNRVIMSGESIQLDEGNK